MVTRCEHFNFTATVEVGRLTNDRGKVKNYMADITVKCADCGKRFQFLGLKPGLDLQGARVSIDGLEARIGLCPAGEQPSALDRIAVNFPTRLTQ
jgi:hypothetical protein